MFKDVFEIWQALIEGRRIRAVSWDPEEYIELNLKNGSFTDENGKLQEYFNFSGQTWSLWEPLEVEVLSGLTFEEAKNRIMQGHDVTVNFSYRADNGETVKCPWTSSGGEEEFFDILFCDLASRQGWEIRRK